MTTPGGDSGENAHDGVKKSGPSGQPPGGSERNTPGEPAFSGFEPPSSGFEAPPPPGYPPPAYPPPSFQQPGYPPPGSPPTGYGAPPGYQNASGYGASYPPVPPEYGSSAGGYGQPYPGGYPGPDYAGGYGPPPRPGTNTLAIVSLVSSFIGLLCGIGSIVGIVLGAVALNQIKQTRQEGYGLAVAGIVVGVATLLVSLIITIYALR
ncbi:DUF4190 domain-containing protein [Mycobacterium heckeshornense]|uniref:DUF4190 domain-containing protein n=1 Tax=Mycobacterium heckeshornense TaxID=110505 RepID=UPI0006628151|nr:DUF4190 domain-containing protein [Mycobacterium heckeshornense]KMV22293.1 hypothetical protein ACT16_11710 [Mycobacterium heckeshornense]PIJ33268.1 DUF4190 domain-containing protein [Mycobacterium heckeshornense]BCQ08182.1 hypothetical protein JMUB5695_01607 [Mycobacterium heckeshornense]